MQPPSLSSLIGVSLRIGNLTFGGGDPAMAALQREAVEHKGWISQDDFTLIWGLSRVTPGTNVLACFAGVGWRLAEWPGAVAATLGSSLPAGILCYWLAAAEAAWRTNPWFAAGLRGVGAVVAAMMLSGAALLLKPAWRDGRIVRAMGFTAAAALAAAVFHAPPVVVLAFAALVGFWWSE